MGNNIFFVSSTTNLTSESLVQTTGKKGFDSVRIIYEYLFSSEDSLKDKNKYLFLFLQHHIKENNIDIVGRFLNDSAIKELHPSLLKSALIMTDNVLEVNQFHQIVEEILNQKI